MRRASFCRKTRPTGRVPWQGRPGASRMPPNQRGFGADGASPRRTPPRGAPAVLRAAAQEPRGRSRCAILPFSPCRGHPREQFGLSVHAISGSPPVARRKSPAHKIRCHTKLDQGGLRGPKTHGPRGKTARATRVFMDRTAELHTRAPEAGRHGHPRAAYPRSSVATHSTWRVCGNMSTGVTRSRRYPRERSSDRSRACVTTLHET